MVLSAPRKLLPPGQPPHRPRRTDHSPTLPRPSNPRRRTQLAQLRNVPTTAQTRPPAANHLQRRQTNVPRASSSRDPPVHSTEQWQRAGGERRRRLANVGAAAQGAPVPAGQDHQRAADGNRTAEG
uniref:(northern house mosquito) hypothetical protein n=1 Tax=Culex pipiens TaxID=7175 RepID=A0A8D8L8H9_CULPI